MKLMDQRDFFVPLVWLCTVLFSLRVLGQVYVALYAPRWLPPMPEWYSGLLPYYLLLPTQLIMLNFIILVAYDYTREEGYFFVTNPGQGKVFVGLASFYFSSMVARYVVTMVRHPERRWFGGTIPIVLHCVLASFVFLVSSSFLFY